MVIIITLFKWILTYQVFVGNGVWCSGLIGALLDSPTLMPAVLVVLVCGLVVLTPPCWTLLGGTHLALGRLPAAAEEHCGLLPGRSVHLTAFTPTLGVATAGLHLRGALVLEVTLTFSFLLDVFPSSFIFDLSTSNSVRGEGSKSASESDWC